MTGNRLTLEVCVDTPWGLSQAVKNGADCIELCSALSLGGLTPSYGLMTQASECDATIAVMIRPRAGGFVYNSYEIDQMARDIYAAKTIGMHGVVFGCLTADSTLDIDAMRELTRAASGMKKTIHRAFDCITDQFDALDTLISLGFDRVLTSGGASSVVAGKTRLQELRHYAMGNIVILGCGGVRSENIADVHKTAQLTAYHSGARVKEIPENNARVREIVGGRDETDADAVARLRAVLDTLDYPASPRLE